MNNKAKVIDVKKNPRGEITDIVLDNGNVYSVDEARTMAADGLLEGVDLEQLNSEGALVRDKTKGTIHKNKEMPETLEIYE